MRLSVVVPMRDAERFVAPLLANLREQGLGPSDYEVVAVDDGSTDGTAGALGAEGARMPNLRVVRLAGLGLGAARNAGMGAAHGDYVYFMDSDDALVPGALSGLLSRCEAEGLDCLLFGGEPVYETEQLKREIPQYRGLLERRWIPDGAVAGRDAVVAQAAAGDFCPCVWLMLLRAEALRSANVHFPEEILNEDNPFALKAMLASRRLAVDPASRYRYSVREGSIMSSNRRGEKRWVAHLELLRLFEAEARRADGEGDAELASAVRELSSWFVEVCVRDCPDDPLGAVRAAPSSLSGLTPEARLARKAADERARAEAAEKRARELEDRIKGLEQPGIRRSLSLLCSSVASRFRPAI